MTTAVANPVRLRLGALSPNGLNANAGNTKTLEITILKLVYPAP